MRPKIGCQKTTNTTYHITKGTKTLGKKFLQNSTSKDRVKNYQRRIIEPMIIINQRDKTDLLCNTYASYPQQIKVKLSCK